MNLTKEAFATFLQPYFSFKQLKMYYSEEEINQLKAQFQQTWQLFKQWNQLALEKTNFSLAKVKVESWTNGWNLRNHFWSPYRFFPQKESAPCLAVLLDREKLMVYLMFQHYKSDASKILPEDYNAVLPKVLPILSTLSEPEKLYLFTNQEEMKVGFISLTDFLQNQTSQQTFLNRLNEKTTWQIAYVLEEETPEISDKIAGYLQTLAPLYQEVTKKDEDPS